METFKQFIGSIRTSEQQATPTLLYTKTTLIVVLYNKLQLLSSSLLDDPTSSPTSLRITDFCFQIYICMNTYFTSLIIKRQFNTKSNLIFLDYTVISSSCDHGTQRAVNTQYTQLIIWKCGTVIQLLYLVRGMRSRPSVRFICCANYFLTSQFLFGFA